jgi:hypothetical protein
MPHSKTAEVFLLSTTLALRALSPATQADVSVLSADLASASLADAHASASFASTSSIDELADASIASDPVFASTPAKPRVGAGAASPALSSETLGSDDSASSLSSVSGSASEDEGADGESLASGSDDSRGPDDAYSGAEDDELDSVADASLADASFAPSIGSLDDEYESSPSTSGSEEDEDEEGGGGPDESADLEWEEAQELAGAAVSAHARALRDAGMEGMFVRRPRTIRAVVEVVRALVHTVGAFDVRISFPSVIPHVCSFTIAGGARHRAVDPHSPFRALPHPPHTRHRYLRVRDAGRAHGPEQVPRARQVRVPAGSRARRRDRCARRCHGCRGCARRGGSNRVARARPGRQALDGGRGGRVSTWRPHR